MASTGNPTSRRHAHLSQPDPAWELVAPGQRVTDAAAARFFDLPLQELYAIPYQAPPLPVDVPIPGKDVAITETQIPVRDGTTIGLRIYKPCNPPARSLLLLNAHGGGWVVGTPETEEAQNRFIAVGNNATVVSVDYRKAPGFPHPVAVNDCYDALLWCKSNASSLGIDAERIILIGGSAGANISAVLALKARDEGISGVIGQILNIPVTCHPDHFPVEKYEYGSYEQNKDSAIVNSAKMRWFWDKYLPNAEADPMSSPLLAISLAGLPPSLVQVAGMDPLRDEGIAYAEALKASGNHLTGPFGTSRVLVTLKVYPGLPHAFYSHQTLPASAEYWRSMVKWIHDNYSGDSTKVDQSSDSSKSRPEGAHSC